MIPCFARVVALTSICIAAACGSPQEPAKSEPAAAAPSAQSRDDRMPRDFSGTDLCAVLTGESVAAVLGATLISVEPNLDPVWCTYILQGDDPYQQTEVIVSVDGMGMAFTVGRQTAAAAEAVPGLGAEAWAKKSAGQREVHVRRADDVYVHVVGPDQASAVAVARLAVDSISE